MLIDDHYYTEGYDAASDPYAMPNGVLVNNFGIADSRQLNEIEADLGNLKISQLLQEPAPAAFDASYVRRIHAHIFGDLYPWAGQWRKVDIGKGDTIFLTHTHIQSEVNALLGQIPVWTLSQTTSLDDWSQRAAQLILGLNFIHPFREGNGRTQRVFIQQWGRSLGKHLDWASVGADAMRRACVEGLAGNASSMCRLIRLNVA